MGRLRHGNLAPFFFVEVMPREPLQTRPRFHTKGVDQGVESCPEAVDAGLGARCFGTKRVRPHLFALLQDREPPTMLSFFLGFPLASLWFPSYKTVPRCRTLLSRQAEEAVPRKNHPAQGDALRAETRGRAQGDSGCNAANLCLHHPCTF